VGDGERGEGDEGVPDGSTIEFICDATVVYSHPNITRCITHFSLNSSINKQQKPLREE